MNTPPFPKRSESLGCRHFSKWRCTLNYNGIMTMTGGIVYVHDPAGLAWSSRMICRVQVSQDRGRSGLEPDSCKVLDGIIGFRRRHRWTRYRGTQQSLNDIPAEIRLNRIGAYERKRVNYSPRSVASIILSGKKTYRRCALLQRGGSVVQISANNPLLTRVIRCPRQTWTRGYVKLYLFFKLLRWSLENGFWG